MRLLRPLVVVATLAAAGCDTPYTRVQFVNAFAPTDATAAYVIFQASWQAVSVPGPIAPGQSSDAANTVPASNNPAYVLVAPGWNGDPNVMPTSLIALQSNPLTVHLDDTLTIVVNDESFFGDCAAGSHLPQATADFIVGQVFAAQLGNVTYDAETCTLGAAP